MGISALDLSIRAKTWQHDRVIDSLVHQYRAAISGELSDRKRVIDHLLDVRLAAADRPAVVEVVDAALVDVPGLTTVENVWWSKVLDDVEQALTVIEVV